MPPPPSLQAQADVLPHTQGRAAAQCRRGSSHAATPQAKRFTMRDGFHVSEQRAEDERAAIDQLGVAPMASCDSANANANANASGNQGEDPRHGPHVQHLASSPPALQQAPTPPPAMAREDTAIAAIFGLLQRSPPSVAHTDTADRIQHNQIHANNTNANGSINQTNDGGQPPVSVRGRLPSSTDWLIYRHRPNATPRRRAEHTERLLAEVLAPTRRPHQRSAAQPTSTASTPTGPTPTPTPTPSIRLSSTRPSPPPTARSTSSSSSSSRRCSLSTPRREQRLAAAATAAAATLTTKGTHPQYPYLPANNANNNDDEATTSSNVITPRGAGPFATRRSTMRAQVAVPFRPEGLLTRLRDLRKEPEELDSVLAQQRQQRHARIQQHGANLVARNKHQPQHQQNQQNHQHQRLPPVQDRQAQAQARRQELDQSQERAVLAATNRWHTKRQQQHARDQLHFHQSQWLLIVSLAQLSAQWLRQFTDFRARHEFVVRLTRVRRVQRLWRRRVARHQIASQRQYQERLPVVLRAVHLLQRCTRRWLRHQHEAMQRCHVAVIVTSWLEFQDVKFRRLILRFRKRVREFQTMWRSWRAITEARVKLLLLAWARLERMHRRRLGLATPPDAGTLLAERSPSRQRRLEGMHRHLRNGGAVLTAIAATSLAATVSTGGGGGGGGPTVGGVAVDGAALPVPPASPRSLQKHHVATRHHTELQNHLELDLHVAMSDLFATANLIASSPLAHSQSQSPSHSPSRSPSKSLHTLGHGHDPAATTAVTTPVRSAQAPSSPQHPSTTQTQVSPSPSLASSSPPQRLSPFGHRFALAVRAVSPPRGGGGPTANVTHAAEAMSLAATATHKNKKKPHGMPSPSAASPTAAGGGGGGGGPLALPSSALHHHEKIPLAIKIPLIRQLLSEKRKRFQVIKDRRRAQWKREHQQLRQTDFSYNVLDELAAYQRFQAQHSVFLLLHSVTENDMLHLIQRASQQHAAMTMTTPVAPVAARLALPSSSAYSHGSMDNKSTNVHAHAFDRIDPQGKHTEPPRVSPPRHATGSLVVSHTKAITRKN